jgi:hypothetical protein
VHVYAFGCVAIHVVEVQQQPEQDEGEEAYCAYDVT